VDSIGQLYICDREHCGDPQYVTSWITTTNVDSSTYTPNDEFDMKNLMNFGWVSDPGSTEDTIYCPYIWAVARVGGPNHTAVTQTYSGYLWYILKQDLRIDGVNKWTKYPYQLMLILL